MTVKELVQAIEAGDQEEVVKALSLGIDPCASYDGYDTPLSIAAKLGDRAIVRLLLQAGFDPTFIAKGVSPLCGAIANGNLAVAKLLIESGADLAQRSPIDSMISKTPLQSAVYHEQPKLVQLLLNAGADPNLTTPPTLSPLRAAVGAKTKRATEIVRLLIQGGSNVNEGPQTPLMRACAHGSLEMVQQLIAAGADVNAFDRTLGTALMAAAYYGRSDIVECLVNADADRSVRMGADHRDSANMTALDIAATRKKARVVTILQQGATGK